MKYCQALIAAREVAVKSGDADIRKQVCEVGLPPVFDPIHQHMHDMAVTRMCWDTSG